MKTEWCAEFFQLFIIVAMFIAAALAWSHVPERIPTHWNIRGEVDGYGGRFVGLLLLPLMALGVYLLLRFLPRLDPGYRNYESFAGAYNVIRICILLVLATVFCVTLLAALGYRVDMNAVMATAIGLMFIVLGNVMSKIRPNWFVGVRTPWTLSSKASWNKTHRLAGWLFIVMGVSVIALGFVGRLWMLVAVGALCVASVAWIFIYSYLVWRDDPDRTPPTGTLPSSE